MVHVTWSALKIYRLSQRGGVTDMRRGLRGTLLTGSKSLCSVRNVHIPSSQQYTRSRRQRDDAAQRLNREAALLDSQLRELKSRERLIRSSIREQSDTELQKKLAQSDGAELTRRASSDEIAALEQSLNSSNLQLFPSKLRRTPLQSLPKALHPLISQNDGSKLQLFKPKVQSWRQIVHALASTSELSNFMKNVTTREVETLVVSIPLKDRAETAIQLESIISEQHKSQFVKDSLMAAYAHRREPQAVERLLAESAKPTVFSFAHLAKSYFKSGAEPEKVLSIIQRMSAAGLDPTLPVYTVVVQSLIMHQRYAEAESVFDNLKYRSVATQPDVKLYNAMMLAAAKQHNVNRVLDLLEEMKTRRPFPLQPNAETYNILVYACARDSKTHIMAWEVFIEAMRLGFETNRDSFRALLYLCGTTGEAMLARALVRRLFEREAESHGHVVDDFVLNCLFLSYKNWRPGPSKILSTPIGHTIREHILMDAKAAPFTPSLPLLPIAQLDQTLILAETAAVLEFCADTRPDALLISNKSSSSRLNHSPSVYNFLDVVIQHGGSMDEFKRRFQRFTTFERDSKLEEPLPGAHPNLTLARNQDLYMLALRACIKFRDLDFARAIWTERGEWRRTEQFRRLNQSMRDKYDLQFARRLVEVLTSCGDISEAILVLKSARGLGKWTRSHVALLIDRLKTAEDAHGLQEVYHVLYQS